MTVALDKKRFGPWALVTGASSGIGKEFAQRIAASGINIVLVGRREDLVKEVGVEFSKRYDVEHRVVVLDLSQEGFIAGLADATHDIDIGLVVSNAGTPNPGEFLKLDRQLLQATSLSVDAAPAGGDLAVRGPQPRVGNVNGHRQPRVNLSTAST